MPGVVHHESGHCLFRNPKLPQPRQNLAGDEQVAISIVLALLFIGLKFLAASAYPSPLLLAIAAYGASINSWLAVFNMLPFMGLDGTKVLFWNMKAYVGLLVLAIGAMVLTYAL